MTLRQCETSLNALLSPTLVAMGFRNVGHLSYVRGNNEKADILNFGGRLHKGTFHFGCCVGVRFGRLAELLRPNDADVGMPTVMMPLHLLHSDRKHFEWEFESNGPHGSLLEGVKAEIRLFALPFFDRFRTLEIVETCLKSNNPADWFVLSHEQRLCILAAIACLRGASDESIRILDEALAQRQEALPAKRVLLEDLRAQIVER
jgi:hypothetical protein